MQVSGELDAGWRRRFASRCAYAIAEPCGAAQALAAVEGDPGRLVRCVRAPELGALDPLA